jgi:tetratricopeptide (TPR) repeat protein
MQRLLKHFIPLAVVFAGAFVFFLGYNHYLLDSSLANLKISLKELGKAQSLSDIKRITTLLDDSFLTDLAKGDFDLAFAIKLEISKELVNLQTQTQRQTKDYVVKLSSASNVDFSAVIAQKINTEAQLADIQHFIKTAINKRIVDRPYIISALEDIVITLFPGHRQENINSIKNKIIKFERELASLKGQKLQDKYLEIAKLYLLLKDWQSSKIALEKAKEINPASDTALKADFFSAILYKSEKNFHKSAATFEKIKDKLPKQWKEFSYYQEADSLYKLGQTEKAIALFKQLFAMDPSLEISQLSQFRAAYAYLYDLKNTDEAVATFKKLKQQEPKIDLSSYIEDKINPDIAWQYCVKGFRLLEAGYRLSDSEKYKESLNEFLSAIKLIPSHSTSHIGEALAFYFLNQPEEAIKAGLYAIRANPNDTEAFANLGFIYFNLGMLTEAIEQCQQAVRLKPDSDIYNYNLATFYVLTQKYPQAERYFRQVKNYAYAYNNLGYVLWLKGQHVAATENLKKAIALRPDYTDAHYNLGIVYFTLGKYEEAQKEFKQTQAITPSFRRTGEYLREVASKLGYK